MNYCSNCGTQIIETAAFCTGCGQPTKAAPSNPVPPPVNNAFAQALASQDSKPPSLHWALVLLFCTITFGFFVPFWVLYQWSYFRKVAPVQAEQSKVWIIGCAVAYFLALFVTGPLAALILIAVVHQMLPSLLETYRVNGVRLEVNKPLAYVFTIFYVQHHLTQIANAQKAQPTVLVMQQPAAPPNQ